MRRRAARLLFLALIGGLLTFALPATSAATARDGLATHSDDTGTDSTPLVRARTRDTDHAPARLAQSGQPAPGWSFSLRPASSVAIRADRFPLASGLGRRAPSRAPPR